MKAELIALVVDAAERRKQGELPAEDVQQRAAQLAVEVGAQEGGFEAFFTELAQALKARGLAMPRLDDLPDAIAPYAAMFGHAVVLDPSGEVDMDATVTRLDAEIERTMGRSPRKAREAALRAEIDRDMRARIAESMRQHGLTPLADMRDRDDDDP